MANTLTATTGWNVRAGGNELNGGGFDTVSSLIAPILSLTDAVAANATTLTSTITSVTGGFTAAMIAHAIKLNGQIYFITARASTNSITVEGQTGAVTGGTLTVGESTNWSRQDAPHVSIDGVTVIGTVAGAGADVVISGYTVSVEDKWNVIRISAGTNCVVEYCCITAVDVGTGTWTLGTHSSAAPFTGASADMVARMGGAWADDRNWSTSGTLTPPALATPVVRGNIIWVDGNGITNPTPAQAIHDYSAGTYSFSYTGYYSNFAMTRIRRIGVNGTPAYKTGASFMDWGQTVQLRNAKIFMTTSASYVLYKTHAIGVTIDTAGFNATTSLYEGTTTGYIAGNNQTRAQNVMVINSGSLGTGSGPAFRYVPYMDGCIVKDYNGVGCTPLVGEIFAASFIHDCVFSNCYGYAMEVPLIVDIAEGGHLEITRCTFDSTRGSGFHITSPISGGDFEPNIVLQNSNFTNNSAYGIVGDANIGVGSFFLDDCWNNNFYGNGTADRLNFAVMPGDIALNPNYKDPTNLDWSPGTNLKGLALSNLAGSVDIGGMQRVEAAASTVTVTPFLGGIAARRS